jgi:hypothetical protein
MMDCPRIMQMAAQKLRMQSGNVRWSLARL